MPQDQDLYDSESSSSSLDSESSSSSLDSADLLNWNANSGNEPSAKELPPGSVRRYETVLNPWKQQGDRWEKKANHKIFDGRTSKGLHKDNYTNYEGEHIDAQSFRKSAAVNQGLLEKLAAASTKDPADLKGDDLLTNRVQKLAHQAGPKLDPKTQELKGVRTNYFNKEEQNQHTVTVKDGKLVGPDGKPLDTTRATGYGGFGSDGAKDVLGRHIFAMTPGGTLRTADAWGDTRLEDYVAPKDREDDSDSGSDLVDSDAEPEVQRPREVFRPTVGYGTSYGGSPQGQTGQLPPAQEQGPESANHGSENSKVAKTLAYVNHSSLVAGGDVGGAGEMRVENGEVKVVSNNTGHYRTEAEHMHQTVGRLADQGVGLEGMTTEFTDPTTTKLAGPEGFDSGRLQAGALEFMAYHGAHDAETQMRKARNERMGLMDQVRAGHKLKKVAGQSDRSGVTDATKREYVQDQRGGTGKGIMERIAKLRAKGLKI